MEQLKFEVYGKEWCAYCERAKQLLESKNVAYNYKDVEKSEDHRSEMLSRNPSARTVPQIFVDNEPIGGYDNLRKWFKENKVT